MKMNTTFKVIARCVVNTRGAEEDTSWKEDVTLEFDNELAETFLSRFAPEGFKLNDFKLLFKNNGYGKIEGIALFKDENVYVITNPNQVISEVIDGYNKLKFLSKVEEIISFDYDAAVDFAENKEEVEDEFGEK